MYTVCIWFCLTLLFNSNSPCLIVRTEIQPGYYTRSYRPYYITVPHPSAQAVSDDMFFLTCNSREIPFLASQVKVEHQPSLCAVRTLTTQSENLDPNLSTVLVSMREYDKHVSSHHARCLSPCRSMTSTCLLTMHAACLHAGVRQARVFSPCTLLVSMQEYDKHTCLLTMHAACLHAGV
jgi:hypothetical protein